MTDQTAQDYFLQARRLSDEGDIGGAFELYNQIVEIDPSFADAFCMRGNIHAQRGELDAAIADYTRAIELNPSDSIAVFNRGSAYAELGDNDAAIADFRHYVDMPGAKQLGMDMAVRQWIEQLEGA